MDLEGSVLTSDDPSSSPPHPQEGMHITSINEEFEIPCWGCGSQLLLPAYSPIFKCGWCGAITNQNAPKQDNKGFWWRRLRDRFFVVILILFLLFVICGGTWAVYPIVFSIGYFFGIFNCVITAILSVSTISAFSLAAFRSAGAPPLISWGSYRVVGKGALENYTFCQHCLQPKSPKTHHCRSCRMCVLNMDHHCPFIGNCIGAENHRSFVLFLISAVISTIYVCIMSIYAGFYIWPPLNYKSLDLLGESGRALALKAVKEFVIALLNSAMFLSVRGLVLFYLCMCSVSVGIGLGVLLWQQLYYIYEGSTYLDHLSSQGGEDVAGRRDCLNVAHFFGCSYIALRYLPRFQRTRKRHVK